MTTTAFASAQITRALLTRHTPAIPAACSIRCCSIPRPNMVLPTACHATAAQTMAGKPGMSTETSPGAQTGVAAAEDRGTASATLSIPLLTRSTASLASLNSGSSERRRFKGMHSVQLARRWDTRHPIGPYCLQYWRHSSCACSINSLKVEISCRILATNVQLYIISSLFLLRYKWCVIVFATLMSTFLSTLMTPTEFTDGCEGCRRRSLVWKTTGWSPCGRMTSPNSSSQLSGLRPSLL